jgi:hypothetical protein
MRSNDTSTEDSSFVEYHTASASNSLEKCSASVFRVKHFKETWIALCQRRRQTLDFSEMLVTVHHSTWHNTPECLHFHYYHCEIIRTCNFSIICKENVGLDLELKTGQAVDTDKKQVTK